MSMTDVHRNASTKPERRLRAAIEKACAIIERGDQRLLALDGPCGGEPPALTLAEWRELYVILDRARST